MGIIRKYVEFIKEQSLPTLEYFYFDWDDNLLSMPTKINMENLVSGEWVPVRVATDMFAEIRGDKENWRLGKDPFIEFGDEGPRGETAFTEDMKSAIGGSKFPQDPVRKSPSWDEFIGCLKGANLFAIITARGHKPSTIRKGVEWIIDNYLDDGSKQEMYSNCLKFKYLFGENVDNERLPSLDQISSNPVVSAWLDNCGYYGVSYKGFIDKHKSGGAESPEVGKEIAIKEFVSKCANYARMKGWNFRAGMSDDDAKNVMHMKTVLSELKDMYPEAQFTVIDTSKGGYVKTKL